MIPIDPADLPYPPTHPQGQHRMWTDEEIAAVQSTARQKATAAGRPDAEQRREQAGADLGFSPEKWAAMNRAQRRAAARSRSR